jgi:hypothetical protein
LIDRINCLPGFCHELAMVIQAAKAAPPVVVRPADSQLAEAKPLVMQMVQVEWRERLRAGSLQRRAVRVTRDLQQLRPLALPKAPVNPRAPVPRAVSRLQLPRPEPAELE